MQVDTNIQNNLTKDEKELFSIIKRVIEKYTPSTQAFVAGGWTRDKLLGIPSDDIDIMLSNISGEDFAKLVTKYLKINDPHIIRENPEKSKHITTARAYIPLSSGKAIEVDFAQARSEIYHEDSRIPDLKPATPQEDAHRRDLTINSIFYSINDNKIVDYTGEGIKDLVTMTIRTPEDPLKTFKDDPLRIFRTIRFAAKYGGTIDPDTYKAMQDPSLRNEINQKVSKERIGTEITKMLKNPNPIIAIQLLKDTGLWQDIVTEALRGSPYEGKMAELNMEQQNIHHRLNVWGHTMEVAKHIMEQYDEADPEKRVTMILDALMHDIGKLYTDIQAPSKTVPGAISYHGHEKESQEIANHILRYLKMEPYIQQVAGLVQYHMRPHKFTEEGVGGIRAMRRFIRQMGEASLNWIDIFNLAVADAYSKDVIVDPQVIRQYQDLETKLQEALLSMGPIKEGPEAKPILNGNEVMQILNIKPGPHMTEIMEFVKELKDENPNITKEEAAEKLKEKYQNGFSNEQEIKEANKKEQKSLSICPSHLFRKKNEEIIKAIKNGNYYEVFSILNNLKDEYKDEKISRLIAVNMLKLLLIDEKYRNNELIQYIFDKADEGFFDHVLCSYVFGILLLIETKTEEDIIKTIGNRMLKMSPGTLKTVLNMLPEKVYRSKIKKEFENKLK